MIFAVDLTPNPDYSLIQETIALVQDFLVYRGQTLRPFSLEIRGKMEREGKKFGLGSSGSIVVLVIKALLALYKLSVDQDLLFKLASAVLLKRGDNGSMGGSCLYCGRGFGSLPVHLIARRWLLG